MVRTYALMGRMVAVALCGCSSLAMAQTAAPVAPPADAAAQASDQGQIQDIIVTAQKRGENLQNVPISISAVTAATIKAAAVGGTLDIGVITPGLTVTKTGNAPLVFLRGVGTALGGTPGDEGGVNIVVDGVVYTSLPGSVFSLNNIERIEVLRGPQGTLFGRNATGGVVSIITRDPSYTTSADLEAGYGDYNTVEASGYLTGKIANGVRADLAVQYSDQQDGFGRDLTTGKKVLYTHDFSVRSKIILDLGPQTMVRLSGDYESVFNDYGVSHRILPGTVSSLGQTGPAGFFDTTSNLQPAAQVKTGGGSIKIDQGLSFAQLVSISAYRDSNSSFDFDQDAGALPLVDATFINREHQFTEELQLSSLSSSRIKWIVGAFYLNSTAKEVPLTLSGLAFGPALFDARYGVIDTKSYAGYAQTTIPLGDATNITGGLRYTSDQRHFNFYDTSGLGVGLLPTVDTSKTFNRLTWRIALDHKITNDILAYASMSTGFKAGSFNIINPLNPAIQPEKLYAYEVGLKNELFDRHVRLNLAGFYYDYKSIQVNQVVQGTTLFLNAPAEIYGGDVDFEVRPTSRLVLSGGFEALHSDFRNFPNAPGSLPLPAVCGPNGPVAQPGPAAGGNITCPINAKGNQLIRAPNFNSSLTATYTYPSSVGEFGISGTYSHSASFPWEIDGRLRQPAFDIVNGQISWTSLSKRYVVRLWARNLNNERYYILESSSLGDTGSPAPPRTFGGSVQVHF